MSIFGKYSAQIAQKVTICAGGGSNVRDSGSSSAHLGQGCEGEGEADGVEAEHLHAVHDMAKVAAHRVRAASQITDHCPPVPHKVELLNTLQGNIPPLSLSLSISLHALPAGKRGVPTDKLQGHILPLTCLAEYRQVLSALGIRLQRKTNMHGAMHSSALPSQEGHGHTWPYTELKPKTERPLRMISLPCASMRVGPLGPGPVDSARDFLPAAA